MYPDRAQTQKYLENAFCSCSQFEKFPLTKNNPCVSWLPADRFKSHKRRFYESLRLFGCSPTRAHANFISHSARARRSGKSGSPSLLLKLRAHSTFTASIYIVKNSLCPSAIYMFKEHHFPNPRPYNTLLFERQWLDLPSHQLFYFIKISLQNISSSVEILRMKKNVLHIQFSHVCLWYDASHNQYIHIYESLVLFSSVEGSREWIFYLFRERARVIWQWHTSCIFISQNLTAALLVWIIWIISDRHGNLYHRDVYFSLNFCQPRIPFLIVLTSKNLSCWKNLQNKISLKNNFLTSELTPAKTDD